MAARTGDTGGSSRSVEIELKFDVDGGTPLPEWGALPGVASVSTPEPRDLDAQYLDTSEMALARSGYALRRRTGGPDAGWHIKGPRQGHGRTEDHWPLGADDAVPSSVLDAVRTVVPEATDVSLTPLARIRNDRVAYNLLDADGGVLAEFVDDHVVATDLRRGVERTWREWEVELGSAGPADPAEITAFFGAVVQAVTDAGGRPAASASKLARALGY